MYCMKTFTVILLTSYDQFISCCDLYYWTIGKITMYVANIMMIRMWFIWFILAHIAGRV